MLVLNYIVLLIFCTVVGGEILLQQIQVCVDTCWETIGQLTFAGTDESNEDLAYYNGICQNPLLVVSIYACAQTYCTSDESPMTRMRICFD